MSQPFSVCIISGSARAQNNTLRVAKALQKQYEKLNHKVDLVDFRTYDIPLINQGPVDRNNLTVFQKGLVDAMYNASLIIVITPEYNWSTTPEILNWLHRFGDRNFKDLFDEKVFASVGVSTGKGGKVPALHINSILSKIISFTDLNAIVSSKIFESHFTKEVIDEDGNLLGNEAFNAGLADFIQYTNRITNRWML
ncbi:MAG: NAD(P)H-dependent oxidoreductase [Bacteroidia bacterium]|jgi:chromate reductase|nr:NAD(P)H-dependent oxidoreductase [Bacteroidia bacterium]